MKVPGLVKTMVDPMGLGVGDALFGANKGPDYAAQQAAQKAALEEAKRASEEFLAAGPAKYGAGADLKWKELQAAEQQAASGMQDISTDPRYKDAEMSALADLEDQSKNGFTARDRAEMAQVEQSANRANQGRIGAIQQNMQARGMTGSGMDMVAQMQSAQDSADMEAMRALEQQSQMLGRKQDATSRLGSLSSTLQGRDFNQEAQKAQAQDSINRFNTQNTNDVNQYNNQGSNQRTSANWSRQNVTSDNNTNAQTQYNKDALNVKQGQAQQNFNSAVDDENRLKKADADAMEATSGKFGAVLGTAGGVVGGIYGGPAGAAAGSQVGNAAGRQMGATSYKNSYGSDKRLKDNIRDEHPLEIEAFLDSIAPKSFDYKDGEGEKDRHGVLADDLAKTSIGRSLIQDDEKGMKNIKVSDAISALLQAVSHINKKVK